MSQTRPRPTARPTGRRAAPPQRNGGNVLRGLGSLLALLVLVVGVPVLLLWLGDGLPIPTSLPDRDTLTSQVGTDELITVLVAITWLAWLQFVVCVGVELVSELRGVGLPARVPWAGPSQRLARGLVAGVLLLATLIGGGGAATAATVERVPSVSAIGATPLASSAMHASTQLTTPPPLEQVAVAPVSVEGQTAGTKVYTVQPPQGRHHDSLWDIAERCLGDGLRYKEIFGLNQGVEQADGRALTKESLIYPGWVLVMPGDAVGVDVIAPPAPPPAAPAPAPALPEPSSPLSENSVRAVAPDLVAAQDESTRSTLPRDLMAAGLLAAGLSAALLAARRRLGTSGPPLDDAADAEVALRVGAEPGRAALLDSTLRRLAATCRRLGRPLPSVYAARVLDGRVDLRLAPADVDPPMPWTTPDGGRTWSCTADAADLREVASGDVLAPYPGLVGVGRDDDGAHVLIDLEAASGPVSVFGDELVAREIVLAAATELATNSWSDHLRVTLVGLPNDIAALAPGRMRVVDSVGAVLPELQQRADQLRGRGDGVLTGRLLEVGGDAWMPEYLVLGEQPSDDDMSALTALLGHGQRAPFGVLVASDVAAARWRLHAGSDGRLTSEVLGLDVEAQRLSEDSAALLHTLFDTARAASGSGLGLRSVDEANLPEDRAPLPPDFTPSVSTSWPAAVAPRATVSILGPIDVHTGGVIEPNRAAQAEELAVYLALHPGGVHPNVLSSALWPRGVTVAVREAALARFRDWIGVDDTGRSLVVSDEAGRVSLQSTVSLDWSRFCSHVSEYRRDPRRDPDHLRRALDLVRGPLLAGRPGGRYSWLAREPIEYDVPRLVVDTAHVLAAVELDRGDAGAASAAARAGLSAAPAAELLWRDLIKAEHVVHGRAGAQMVLDELLATQAADRESDGLEAQTEALVDELVPQRRLTVT